MFRSKKYESTFTPKNVIHVIGQSGIWELGTSIINVSVGSV